MPFRRHALLLRPAHLSLRKVCATLSFTVLVACTALAPAYAGQWQLTITGSGSGTLAPSRGGPTNWAAPSPEPQSNTISTSFSISVGGSVPPSSTYVFGANANVNFSVAAAWLPNGSLAADPEPAVLRLTEAETPAPQWNAAGNDGTNSIAGSGSVSLTGLTVGTKQYTMPSGFSSHSIVFQGKGNVTVTTPVGGYGSGAAGTGFNYSATAAPITATLTVDQDQQIFPPAATTRFSATVSNASGFTIDSVKISVDGTPTSATVNPSNSNNYYIDWPQTGGNPSEHTITATAQIHDSIGALSLDSTDLPNRQYATSGMGRAADDIIADVHLQSIKFSGNITLNQDAVTPVPTPEFTWTGGGTNSSTANPAAYVQGRKVNLALLLGSSAGAALTGNATMGYLCKLQASPNTTNPATNAADPVLTLYDNTTASPTVPASCSASTTVAATTALNGWVSSYTTSFQVLTFYVEFTKIPTPTWSVLSSYNSSVGNTVYATVAAPTAPMASPWVGVLSYACNWAKRTTSATSATTALTIGEYNAGHYNQGNPTGFTGPFLDGQEDFYPTKFINAGLTGQCNDFADFLCCVSNSIGAVPLQPQRSASVNDYNNGSSFTTKPITASGTPATTPPSPGNPVTWAYHQWTTSNVFDGCLLFGGTVSPNNLALQSYHDSLVATTLHTNPIFDWDPQSAMTLNVK